MCFAVVESILHKGYTLTIRLTATASAEKTIHCLYKYIRIIARIRGSFNAEYRFTGSFSSMPCSSTLPSSDFLPKCVSSTRRSSNRWRTAELELMPKADLSLNRIPNYVQCDVSQLLSSIVIPSAPSLLHPSFSPPMPNHINKTS